MTTHISTVRNIKERISHGDQIKKIAYDFDISERTIRRWIKNGFPGDKNSEKEFELVKKEGGNEITVADLIKVGFRQNVAPIMVASLGIAQRQKNNRLARYLDKYISLKHNAPDMHESWCALIAGFPILAEDIASPSLKEVGALAFKYSPYLSKEARKQYQKEIKLILIKVLAEVQTFLQNAASAGGFPIALTVLPPPGKILKGDGISFRIDDSLEQGRLDYTIPSNLYELSKKLPVKRTWAVLLFDIISRLPNPDKQKGKDWKKWQLTSLLYKWFSTAPRDFTPPLPDIEKRPATIHTLGELYTKISEYTPSQNE